MSSENVVTEKLKKESVEDPFEEMDKEEKEKYEKYVADYTRYLKAKYFSDKTIFGGNIYDVKMTSDGQTVKASRLPPYQSFADPASFHALLTSVSKPEEETTAETSNGKQTAKKSN